jgi:hypothetical protein
MAKIKFRRDIASSWASANSVLSQGEPGLDITHNALKIGDGTTAWANLDYIANKPYPTPHIEYTGVFNGLPDFWRYSSIFPKLQYSSNGAFRSDNTEFYWLDQNFDDGDYDLSGVTTLRFTNIGGIRGYFNIARKTEVAMTSLDLGEIAVIDEYYNVGGFSNTLTTFTATNLIDVGGNFEIYGNQFVSGPRMDFSALDRITGHLYIDYNNGNSDYFRDTPAPTFPTLKYVGNVVSIYYNKYSSWSDFTSLQKMIGNFNFYQNTNNDSQLFNGPGMPALSHLQYGNLYYYQNSGMQHISEFAALDRIDGSIYIFENDQLTSFPSFPILTYVAGVYAYSNPSMTSLDGANTPGGWLPGILIIDGNVDFHNCALNQTSVDDILLKLSLLDGTNGTTAWSYREVNLNSGTNAAPSQTGLDAKAILEARNCIVNVNI